jgi:hypothetical protein
MARYVMVLRGATSLQGALEGVGPEKRDFFGPCNGTREQSVIMLLSQSGYRKYPAIGAVRHVTGNDQDYLRKIPRVVVQKSALL